MGQRWILDFVPLADGRVFGIGTQIDEAGRLVPDRPPTWDLIPTFHASEED